MRLNRPAGRKTVRKNRPVLTPLSPHLAKDQGSAFSLACILICPDKLGDINQDHGRVVGDQLIQQVSQLFKNQLESDERLFHCDGANFAIVIPERAEGYAKRRAATVKNLFRDEKFSVDGVDFSDMTCSAGTAEVTGEIEKVKISETTDKLYNELCDRLYRAKASGGDYVVGSPRANRMA